MSKIKRKENLQWKLDLLQAQKDPENALTSRLIRAKKAVEKTNKKASESGVIQTNGDSISESIDSDIASVRQQIVGRKLYHGTQEIYRGLKKARTIESMKLVKRIKQARSQGETDRISNLEAELKVLKELNLQEASDQHAVKSVLKAFLATKTQRENPPSFLPTKITKALKNSGGDSKSKVFQDVIARLYNVSTVKNARTALLSSIKNVAGLSEAEVEAVNDITEENHTEVLSDDNMQAEDDTEDAEDTEETEDDPETEEADEDETEEQESNSTVEQVESQELSSNSDSDSSEDEFFAEDSSKPKPSSKSSKSSNKKTPISLPALATGYISGSEDDEFDVDNDRVVRDLTDKRKNRRGQRARQKIWEQKYGNRANHVQKEREESMEKRRQRQAEYEAREAKRQKTGLGPTSYQKRVVSQPVKQGSNELHPSWEAKKRTSAPVKFQGSKIKFE